MLKYETTTTLMLPNEDLAERSGFSMMSMLGWDQKMYTFDENPVSADDRMLLDTFGFPKRQKILAQSGVNILKVWGSSDKFDFYIELGTYQLNFAKANATDAYKSLFASPYKLKINKKVKNVSEEDIEIEVSSAIRCLVNKVI